MVITTYSINLAYSDVSTHRCFYIVPNFGYDLSVNQYALKLSETVRTCYVFISRTMIR